MGGAERLLSIVIPVYNEGASIGRLLDMVVEHVHVPFEVLVVYDFDEDDTLPALSAYPGPKLDLRLVKNRQRGALRAIETGLLESHGGAALVMMADLSDDLRIVDEMFRLIEQGYGVVCGSRYMKGGRQIGGPFVKGQLSRLVGQSLHWLTSVPTHDITNSFKMYSREVIERFPIQSNGGFELGMELTAKAYLAGMRVAEIPSVWRDRAEGRSRFKLVSWTPKYLRWYLYLLQGSLKRTPTMRALG